MYNHVRRSNLHAALKERQSTMGKVDRARHLYINGDLDFRAFTKIQDEAGAALVSIYVPEFNDAVEAGKILADFGTLWQSASLASKNRLLRSMVQAVYVDLDQREIIGLLPKESFLAPILAVAERADMAVLDASRQCLGRNGGDGGGSNSPSRRAHKRMCYKLVLWLMSRPREAPRAEPSKDQPVILGPPLPALGRPHPGFMAPGIPASGNCREQT